MSTSPFCTAAFRLNQLDIVVVPIELGGKKSLVKGWHKWGRQKVATISSFARKFPQANIAISCGASGLTIIDLDDPSLLGDAIARFGETPLQVTTPRGGFHLYYKNNGEKNPNNLRKLENLKIDVKGKGGYVLAPPSVIKGVTYQISKGGWDCLNQLPFIKENGLVSRTNAAPSTLSEGERRSSVKKSISDMVIGDGRNNRLFKLARKKAKEVDHYNELESWMLLVNNRYKEPLTTSEVEGIAKSVWSYKKKGTLGKPYVHASHREIALIGSHALHLLLVLRKNHTKRQEKGEPFAIACEAMAKSQVIKGWTKYIYMKARNELIKMSKIKHIGYGTQNRKLKLYNFVVSRNPNVM